MEEGEEAGGSFVVTGAEAPEVFDLIEHALDQIAFFVEVAVIASRRDPVAPGRDDRLGPRPLDGFDNEVGVVTLVGDHGLRLKSFQQSQGLIVLGARSRGEPKTQGVAVAVAKGVDLGA